MALPPDTKVKLIDRHDLHDTFADSCVSFEFNNNLLRFDMCSTRIDPNSPGRAQTATRVPVARIVMPLDAAIALFNGINNLLLVLEEKGVVKREGSGSFIPPGATSH